MRVICVVYIWCFIYSFTLAQDKKYVLIKDTTDSNSIVNKTQQIREFEVRSQLATANINSGLNGLTVDISQLKKLPNIMGDADPFKSLQYMGGISQAGDASANFIVRGGNNDQNQILLNGSQVQNPTHILGLFSVFNPDLIDRMKFMKSGAPAEYGGKLSSVVDIHNFVNIPSKVQIDGSAGLIASRLTLKLPVNNKLALYASQRGSYIGSVVMPLLVFAGINEKFANNSFEFSDTNLGFSYQIKPGTKLSGHFYTGNDRISISDGERYSLGKNKNQWGNKVLGLQLQHISSDKLSFLHSINSSEFYIQSDVNWLTSLYSIRSNNRLFEYKFDVIFQQKKHILKSGLETSFIKTLPAVIQSSSDNNSTAIKNYNNGAELAFYFRDEVETGNILLNIGLRGSAHKSLNVVSTESDNYFKVPIYIGLEPRFFGRLRLNEQSSLKLSANRQFQYFSRVPVVNFGVPLEIFMPVSSMVKPSSVWHFSGGYFSNLHKNHYEFSSELYYKSFSNLIEFGGNLSDLFSSNKLMNAILQGKGWTYGAEFMIKKNVGRFTGWVNYSLGWNYRQFEQINDAKPFFATTDRRHDFSLIAMFKLNNKWHFSTTFMYATGSRLNLPRSWYVIDEKVVLEYSGYNSFKMPDYHRLDISATYKVKPFYKLNSELNFSVYNVYNRANPFQVYYSISSINASKNYKIKMSYLIPVLPTITWKFHF